MELIGIYAGSLVTAAIAGWLAGRARLASAPSPAMRRACQLLRGNPACPVAYPTRKALLRRGLAVQLLTGNLYLTDAGQKLAR